MRKYILTIVMSVVSLSTMANSLTSGLVAYWPFDGNTRDMSGHSYNLSGNVSYTNDRAGKELESAYFTGSSALSIPSGLHVANSLTISVWCKPYGNVSTAQGESLSYTMGHRMPTSQYVLYPSHGGVSSTGKAGVGMLVGQNGIIVIEHADDYCPLPLVWLGNIGSEWTLVTVTISGNGAPILYVNGNRIKSGLASSKKKFIGKSETGLEMGIIGNGKTVSCSSCPYVGLMDDFRIYNRALSAAEVKALYLNDTGITAFTITFNANDGNGSEMEDQVLKKDEGQKLSKNTYRKDGYVFQGWGKTLERATAGTVDYADEQEITIDSDITLYAVWANPPLTLTAESADWSSGSITLRCEDMDTSGASHEYTLEYKNASGEWEEVDGAKNKLAAKGQNANGQDVWVAKLTDTAFSSRLDGLPPVEYRVKEVKEDGSGRVSEGCATRMRHGIFVGVGEFVEDANSMNKLAIDNGGFSGKIQLLTSPGAKYNDVANAFEVVAYETKDKPGDICVIYFSTHGGVYDNTTIGSLVLDDRPPASEDPKKQGYHEGLLAKHIRLLDPDKKGVGVVCIISACYSGAFLDDDNGLKECNELTSWCHHEDLGKNVAWLTAANAESKANAIFTGILLDYGWKRGWALKDKKTTMSFLDLYDCAKKLYDPIVKKLKMSGCEKRNEPVLRNVIAGSTDATPDFSLEPPGKPVGLSASKNRSDVVRVEWTQGAGGKPDEYIVIRRFKETERAEPIWHDIKNNFKEFPKEIASQVYPMQYAVAALNGAGVEITDGFEEGWRTINIYNATFYSNLARLSPDKIVTYIEAGSSLVEELRKVTERYSAADTGGSYEFMGWKATKTDSLNVVSRNLDGSWSIPDIIVNGDLEYYADWVAKQINGMTHDWLEGHQTISTASNGDIARAAAMTAANGCRTVGECYALGINPEDPNDDLKITAFKMKDGKPEITLNHTKDGSGNSFEDRVKILGKAELTDAEWQEVPPKGNPAHRFFKVGVEMP